jgi:hypothetical protein
LVANDGVGFGEETIEGSCVHEVSAHETREGERALDDIGGLLS